MLNFNESGHPVFLGSSASKRGDFKSKGKGKLSIHFCGDENTAELVLRTSSPSISSVSTEQKRTCVASCPAESLVGSERSGKLVAQNNPETMVIPTELSTMDKTPRSNDNVQGNLLHNYEQKIANLQIIFA